MIHVHEKVESTQDVMKNLIGRGGVSHLDAVIAGIQTGGRGRMDRQWLSPPGNLSASIFLRDFRMPLTWVPLWVGHALREAIQSFIPTESRSATGSLKLKWPNDLVLSTGEKLGGILCEKVEAGVIAGVGLNVDSSPVLSDRKSASLKTFLLGHGMNRPIRALEVLESILLKLNQEPDTEALRESFKLSSLFMAGDRIQWRDLRSGTVNAGRMIGIGVHGELRVNNEDGSMQSLFSEEIEGVRQDPGSDQE